MGIYFYLEDANRHFFMQQTIPAKQRILSIDILRGIIMVIMALDHTRDFFHIAAVTDQPTNMATTSPILFFTRWITHFCAPGFVFLSGIAAYLNGQQKTTAQLSRWLLTRGLWLVAVEIIIVSLVLTFNPLYNTIFLLVIWAIGISMVLLSFIIYLPFRAILAIGLLVFFCHNLLDYPEAARQGQLNLFWGFVHGRQAVLPLNATHVLVVGYSFLPWTGLMLLGYCCGKLFTSTTSSGHRKKILLTAGFSLLLLFGLLRAINGYGDPFPWTSQRNSITTLLSFMNANKYPPSLLFCCMTLGPLLIVLALLENIQTRLARFFIVYGSVPLFYFIGHFLLIHLLCVALFFASGHTLSQAFDTQSPLGFRPVNFGYPLPAVYLLWILVVLMMYPLCKKYGKYKSTHRHWWLSYL